MLENTQSAFLVEPRRAVLAELDFEPTGIEPCGYSGCKQVATHRVLCSCGQGQGEHCDSHTEFVRRKAAEKTKRSFWRRRPLLQEGLLFKDCGHICPAAELKILPL